MEMESWGLWHSLQSFIHSPEGQMGFGLQKLEVRMTIGCIDSQHGEGLQQAIKYNNLLQQNKMTVYTKWYKG